MPKKDASQTALSIVEQIAGGPLKAVPEAPSVASALDDAALRRQLMQEMGRRGGKKGGKARAAKLSKSRRTEIAKAAAKKRWKSTKNKKLK